MLHRNTSGSHRRHVSMSERPPSRPRRPATRARSGRLGRHLTSRRQNDRRCWSDDSSDNLIGRLNRATAKSRDQPTRRPYRWRSRLVPRRLGRASSSDGRRRFRSLAHRQGGDGRARMSTDGEWRRLSIIRRARALVVDPVHVHYRHSECHRRRRQNLGGLHRGCARRLANSSVARSMLECCMLRADRRVNVRSRDLVVVVCCIDGRVG